MRAAKLATILPLCCGLLACTQTSTGLTGSQAKNAQAASAAAAEPTQVSAVAVPTLAPMLKRVSPAVVNISVDSTVEVKNLLLDNPEFRQFFHVPEDSKPMTERVHAVGSGVIFDASHGYLLTNQHVVDKADKILVTLSDRRQVEASLVAADPKSDVAVLKISADHLTELPLGQSKNLRVGDYVVAIGDPFGIGQAATFGIVSALGRDNVGIEGYEDFIQTDASINPGNSGGALIDMTGRLVGINTAILSHSSGNVGVGFAIPIDMANAIARELIAHGKVTRGELGVVAQDVTPTLARALGIQANSGAVISDVEPKSMAERAGLKPGDVVMALDGQPILTSGQLRNVIGAKQPGASLRISLLRDGKTLEVEAKLGRPEQSEVHEAKATTEVSAKASPERRLSGLMLAPIPNGSKLYGKVTGVYVAGIASGSGAEEAGLTQGDVIVSADRKPVSSPTDLARIVQAQNKDRPVLLRVQRGDSALFVAIG
jgi:Do/DeqQ family serine protease